MVCVDCRESPECPRCTNRLTYHSANNRLMCHYCGHSQPVTDRCPVCGGRLMKRSGFSQRTGKQYFYYCCEYTNSKDETNKCEFRTWDVPVKEDCPVCGQTMFKKSGKGFKRPFCINEKCENFTPEEKRGGYRKKTDAETVPEGEEVVEPEIEAKKPTAKKTAAKKETSKKPAAKKETTAKKTAAKKETTKKTTAKKTTTKKSSKKAEEENV